MKKLILGACAVVFPATYAFAAPYSWVTWTGVDGNAAFGTINTTGGPVNVELDGPFNQIVFNYPSWTPASTWADGSIIDNAPMSSNNIIQISNVGNFTLKFSQPISNLAFAAWSVGAGGSPVTYSFDHNLSLVAGGPSAEYGGGSITTTANTFTGAEGNGTVLFSDTFDTLNFQVQQPEFWHGFTVGLPTATVPEPASLAVMGLGLAAFAIRRRKSA